jgi:hypothetical protein
MAENAKIEERVAAIERTLAAHTNLWLYQVRRSIAELKSRFKKRDLKPEKKRAVLDALDEAGNALSGKRPEHERFVEAVKKLVAALDGNGVGSCQDICNAIYKICLESGTDPVICTAAYIVCLIGCDLDLGAQGAMDHETNPAAPAGASPNLGSGSFECSQDKEPKGHVILNPADDVEREVILFVVPCPEGSVDVVGGKPKPKIGDDPNHPAKAERVTVDSPQTVIVHGVTVGLTCKGGKGGKCSYRIVQINPMHR